LASEGCSRRPTYVTNIDHAMKSRRSMAKALADFRAKCEAEPSPALERMIKELEAEMANRKEGTGP